MPLLKTTRLILTFYSSFCVAAIVLTAAGGALFYKYKIEMFSIVFWFKVATNALIWYCVNNFKANEFYYYQNLGISKKWLWILTLSLDFLLFFLTLIIIHYYA